jgi:hypothetical protein
VPHLAGPVVFVAEFPNLPDLLQISTPPQVGGFFLEIRLNYLFFLWPPLNSTAFSQLLARSGTILLILFGVVVAFDTSPPKLLQPDWLLNFGVTLSNTVSIPFVGIVLVNIASYIDLQACNKLYVRVARLSALLALLFLFIQPMLAFALWKNFRDLKVYNKEQSNVIQRKGIELKRAIQKSMTFQDLQINMARLQGPSIPDQARAVPLAELKKQLLYSIQTAQQSFASRLPSPTSDAYKEIYKRLARTSLISVLGTIGFAFLARNPNSEKNIILLYLKSMGLFGLTPASIYRSYKTYRENQLEKKQIQSSTIEKKRSSLNYQRQLRKAESQQQREQKRRMNEERKVAEKRRREREQLLEIERKRARKQELEEQHRDR